MAGSYQSTLVVSHNYAIISINFRMAMATVRQDVDLYRIFAPFGAIAPKVRLVVERLRLVVVRWWIHRVGACNGAVFRQSMIGS